MSAQPWRSPLIVAGLCVWLVCLIAWGIAWAVDPELALDMGGTFAAFLVGGVVAAVPSGLALGLPPVVVGFTILGPDLGAVLVAYPFTKRGLEVLGRWSTVVHNIREKAQQSASARRGLIVRSESFGLFLLSLTPIAYVSPVVVAAIGQLMGLSRWRVLVPVIAGMIVLTSALIFVFRIGFGAVAKIDPRLPFIITGAIIAALVAREIWARAQKKRKTKARLRALERRADTTRPLASRDDEP